MPSKKRTQSKKNPKTKSTLVLTVEELRRSLGVGRAAAYALAREIGRRVGGRGRGRLLVPREALNTWLRGRAAGGAS